MHTILIYTVIANCLLSLFTNKEVSLEVKVKNKVLDNASSYLEGMLTRPPSEGRYLDFQKGEGKFAIVIMDSDGDLILGDKYVDITSHYLDSGSTLSGEFSNGTGKYEGISGKFE